MYGGLVWDIPFWWSNVYNWLCALGVYLKYSGSAEEFLKMNPYAQDSIGTFPYVHGWFRSTIQLRETGAYFSELIG